MILVGRFGGDHRRRSIASESLKIGHGAISYFPDPRDEGETIRHGWRV
jgi:hypothetical protein